MQRKKILERVTAAADLGTEPLPGVPLVELAGECRVLIEHHMGVTGYSDQVIHVKVCYGCIQICGCNLSLACMSKERLIITGRIDAVKLLHGR